MEARPLNPTNQAILELIRKECCSGKHGQFIVLDNGCDGARAELAPFLVELDAVVIGLDISHAELVDKKNRFSSNQKLKLVCGTCEKLPFKDGSFNACIMVDVIEHLPDPLSALQEVSRCLQTPGVFVFSTPNKFGLWTIATEYVFSPIRRLLVQGFTKGYLEHASLLALSGWYTIIRSARFDRRSVFSPTGLGVLRLIQAFAHKLGIPSMQRHRFFGSLSSYLLRLEARASARFPLQWQSDWVFVMAKQGGIRR